MPKGHSGSIENSLHFAYHCSKAGNVTFIVPLALAIGLGSGTITLSTAITVLCTLSRVSSTIEVAKFVAFKLYPLTKTLVSLGKPINQEQIDQFDFKEIYVGDDEEEFILITEQNAPSLKIT